MEAIESLKQILKRERNARKVAEQIIEDKSRELYLTNQQLEEQAAELRKKSRELFVLNEQLKSLNGSLEEQVASRTIALQEKIVELKNSNRYKSEFLANMSHELRTPLNSILVLANILGENMGNNLTEKQVEHANIIQSSGKDLLTLINNILDLAKIEAGKTDLLEEEIPVADIKTNLLDVFYELSRKKEITLSVLITENVPSKIFTDKQKLLQILRNFLSNAFKFTEAGGRVQVIIDLINKNTEHGPELKFSVSDNGIGIEPDMQELIFNAFQQADGSISRKYGGTGLGLSICRELATMFNGKITLKSEFGSGSTFDFICPLKQKKEAGALVVDMGKCESGFLHILQQNKYNIVDDRSNISRGEHLVLILEDDNRFAQILKKFSEERGFKTILLDNGQHGFAFARKYQPVAILVDTLLPEVDGWSVLKSLKSSRLTCSIPVHIFSFEDKVEKSKNFKGKFFSIKPVDLMMLERTFNSIQEISPVPKQCLMIGKNYDDFFLYYGKIHFGFSNVKFANDADGVLGLLGKEAFEILFLMDAEIEGMDMLSFLNRLHNLMKTQGKSVELFCFVYNNEIANSASRFHNVIFVDSNGLEKKYGIILPERAGGNVSERSTKPAVAKRQLRATKLNSKKFLVVDDDSRNIFVLNCLLDPYNVSVIMANNGQEALERLEEYPAIDIVLMDIMMPVMDGYEAIKRIRETKRKEDLPIVALTAKAMRGDRKEALAVGANAYLTKPIDVDEFFGVVMELL